MAFAGIVAKGVVTYEQIRECQVNTYFANGWPDRGALEEPRAQSDPAAYLLGWFAWDFLLDGLSGTRKIAGGFGGTPFEHAYGVSLPVFYERFAAYRKTLVPFDNTSFEQHVSRCAALRL